MNNMNQLQLDYPVWRLSFSEYGEMKGYDLSQTEATTQWFDARLEARIEAQEEYEDQQEAWNE